MINNPAPDRVMSLLMTMSKNQRCFALAYRSEHNSLKILCLLMNLRLAMHLDHVILGNGYVFKSNMNLQRG